MTGHPPDDGFHEIQLNGKQLVFLFMAATVVSVVIFLCGVLVGRGVRVERAAIDQAEVLAQSPAADVLSGAPLAPAVSVPSGADPPVAAPPPPIDDLRYGKRLEQTNQPVDELKPAAPRPAIVPQVQKGRPIVKPGDREKKAPVEKSTAAAPTGRGESPGSVPLPASATGSVTPAPGAGYAVQVAAVNVRGEADAVAKRLASKGYAAYVQLPTSGTPSVFRVRVGTFKTRREAEVMAAKLQKEEQIKPWVTR